MQQIATVTSGDTITLNVGPQVSAVPLPPALSLLATGLIGLFLLGRRKGRTG